MTSLGFIRVAITAVVFAGGAAWLSAQTQQPDDYSATITSLTEQPRSHRAASPLDAIKANAPLAVDLNALKAPDMTDAAQLYDLGGGHTAPGLSSPGLRSRLLSGNGSVPAASSVPNRMSTSATFGASSSGSLGQRSSGVSGLPFPASPGSASVMATPFAFPKGASPISSGASALPSSSGKQYPASLSHSSTPEEPGRSVLPTNRTQATRKGLSGSAFTPSQITEAKAAVKEGGSAADDSNPSAAQSTSTAADDRTPGKFFETLSDPFVGLQTKPFEDPWPTLGFERICGEACASEAGGSSERLGGQSAESAGRTDRSGQGDSDAEAAGRSGYDSSGRTSRVFGSRFGRDSRNGSAATLTPRARHQRRGSFNIEKDSRQ
jgi:hypothetical protein